MLGREGGWPSLSMQFGPLRQLVEKQGDQYKVILVDECLSHVRLPYINRWELFLSELHLEPASYAGPKQFQGGAVGILEELDGYWETNRADRSAALRKLGIPFGYAVDPTHDRLER